MHVLHMARDQQQYVQIPVARLTPFLPIRDLELLKGAYWSYLEFEFDMHQLSEGNVWEPFLGLLHIG